MIDFMNPEMLSSSFEILTMLIGAFLLGVLFAKSTKPVSANIPKESVASTKLVQTQNSDSQDDLQLIEGIGPGLEKTLQKNGVSSYKDIINLDISGLEDLLISLGGRYAGYNPTTWPDQADLAKRKKWSELEEYQEIMKNAKKKNS